MMAIVGPKYKLCIDVGPHGRNSDVGILEQSEIGKKFTNSLTFILMNHFQVKRTEHLMYSLEMKVLVSNHIK